MGGGDVFASRGHTHSDIPLRGRHPEVLPTHLKMSVIGQITTAGMKPSLKIASVTTVAPAVFRALARD